jgi:hypothetical protein
LRRHTLARNSNFSHVSPPPPQPNTEKPMPVADLRPLVLPDKFPDTWLDQIKKGLKPTWWGAILGSSVLATLISSGLSYLIAVKNIEENRRLEQAKSQRELRVEVVRSRSVAYTKLAQGLDGLAAKLEGVIDLVRIAQQSPINSRTVKRIQEQLNDAGLAARNVQTAKRDPVLSGTEAVKSVDDCMRDLTLALAAAQQNPLGYLGPIRTGVRRLRQLITQIQDQIPLEIDGIK